MARFFPHRCRFPWARTCSGPRTRNPPDVTCPSPFRQLRSLVQGRGLQAAKDDAPLRTSWTRSRLDPKTIQSRSLSFSKSSTWTIPRWHAFFKDMIKNTRAGCRSRATWTGLKKALDIDKGVGGSAGTLRFAPQEPRRLHGCPKRLTVARPRRPSLHRTCSIAGCGDLARNGKTRTWAIGCAIRRHSRRGWGDLKSLINLEKNPSIWGLRQLAGASAFHPTS